MSGNSARPSKKIDRRVTRTRDRLGDALVALLLEKPFENITVQEVLDRAHISRSTFYAHYRDKNDLFLSDVDEFFQGMATLLDRSHDESTRVVPVAEFFSHVAEVREFYQRLIETGKVHDTRELGEAHFARGIEGRLARQPRGRALTTQRRALLAHGFAGALFSQLSWWLSHITELSASEMDEQFHEMVASSVASDAHSRRPDLKPTPTNRNSGHVSRD